MRKILIIILILPFVQIYGQTDKQHRIDIELQYCLDSTQNYTTYGMLECISRATKEWDKELNKNYNELISILSSGQKEKLKKSQRQWIVFRDNEIDFSNQLYADLQGTMWFIAAAQTNLDLNRDRAKKLSTYISNLTFGK